MPDEELIFRWQIREYVSRVLRIADTVPGNQALEPTLDDLLELYLIRPDLRAVGEAELTRLARRLGEEPAEPGLVETLQFLVATLRWPSVRETVRQVAEHAHNTYEAGRGRAWDTKRNAERVLDAFENDWDEAEMWVRYRDT